MKSLIFFVVTGSLMVALVHRVRSLLCRGKDLYVGNTRQRTRAEIMKPLAYKHPDLRAERDVSDWLYPKE